MRPVDIPFARNTVTPVAAAPADCLIHRWPKMAIEVLPLGITRRIFAMRVDNQVAKLTQVALIVNTDTYQVAWVVVHAKRPGCIRCKHYPQGFRSYTDSAMIRPRPAFHREPDTDFRRHRSNFGKGFAEVLDADTPGLRVVRRVEDTKCLCPSDSSNRTHSRRHLSDAFRTHNIIWRQ